MSPEGTKQLGPGMPTIPGLQEYYQVLGYMSFDAKRATTHMKDDNGN